MISDGQAQGPPVPDDRKVDVGARMDGRAGHEFTDYQARKGDDPAQPPVQEGARDEVPCGMWHCRVRGQLSPLHGQGRGGEHLGHCAEQRLGHDQVTT